MKPICPNCDAVLPKLPTRKTKCKACGQFIYVKSTPANRTKRLMTETQAEDAESQWRGQYARSRLDDDLESVGLQTGQDEIAAYTALTRLALDSSVDLHRRKMAAGLLSSPRHSSDLAARVRWAMLAATLELEGLRRHDDRAAILAGQASCPSCRALRGSIWKIDDALRSMPIPNRHCELFLHGGGCCAIWASPIPDYLK